MVGSGLLRPPRTCAPSATANLRHLGRMRTVWVHIGRERCARGEMRTPEVTSSGQLLPPVQAQPAPCLWTRTRTTEKERVAGEGSVAPAATARTLNLYLPGFSLKVFGDLHGA